MSTPILPFAVWASGTNQNSIPANDNSLRNQILNGLVIGVEDDAPGGDADGDIYIVGDTPAGAFAVFDEFDLAIYMSGTWYAFAPADGIVVNVAGTLKTWDGAAYIDAGGGAVDSVNGQTGAVSLALDDLSDVDAIAPTDGHALTWNSSAGKWEPAAPSGGMSNPMSAVGDLIYGGSSGTPTRLAAGTDGYVLTLASGVPTWAAAGGGGGLANWTDGLNSSAPNATVPVASLRATNAATHVDAALVAKGQGATTAQVADNTSTGGNKRGQYATDWQKIRPSASTVADGNYSTLSGGRNNRAQGTDSVVPGGNGNTAAGTSSQAGGLNTTVTGNYSFGFGNVAAASGESAFALGEQTSAGGKYSGATGGKSTARNMLGAKAHASGGFGGVIGDGQHRDAWLGSSTTNATQATSTSDLGAATSTNTVALPNNAAYVVKGTICCREAATGDSSAWEFTAFIKRGANAASTAMVVACTPTLIGQDAGAAAWAVAVDADTSVGGLRCRVTGEAAHSIKWGWDIHSINEVVG